ncbi:hypothetical protein ACFQRK_22575 [Parapedobacter sp. GCM10030251]|uniref:hypothetical protein n=1 Tax=Parapedobacter sp. GCM10030251 TaxID=3273419 RepID=UPI00360B96F2
MAQLRRLLASSLVYFHPERVVYFPRNIQLLGFPIYTPERKDGGLMILEYMRVMDIGATAEIGYQIRSVGLGAFVRYSEGLTNVAKKDMGHDKNRFLSFGLSCAVSRLF